MRICKFIIQALSIGYGKIFFGQEQPGAQVHGPQTDLLRRASSSYEVAFDQFSP